jgi:GlpG protein
VPASSSAEADAFREGDDRVTLGLALHLLVLLLGLPSSAWRLHPGTMRQVGTLIDAVQAQRLADYLLTLGISTRVLPEKEGASIWIRDEGHVERARKEFGEFATSPGDSKYDAGRLATEIRREEEALAREAQKRYVDVRANWGRIALRQMPVTVALIGISVFVFLASNMGKESRGILSRLFLTDFEQIDDEVRAESLAGGPSPIGHDAEVVQRVGELREIQHGEIWRIVTPMFIHFGIFHILGNMWFLHELGGNIERRRGHWRFLVLVLVIAAISNLAEFWLPDPLKVLQGKEMMAFSPDPSFGGMSGVVYGLFGYVWVQSRLDPTSGLYIDEQTVMWMLLWLVVCTLGIVGPIANIAHAMGLIVGATIGYVRSIFS